jgi:hypothetical protein
VVTNELRLDPVDRRAIPIGALAAVAEAREAFNSRLVFLKLKSSHEDRDRIFSGGMRRSRSCDWLGLGANEWHKRQAESGEDE